MLHVVTPGCANVETKLYLKLTGCSLTFSAINSEIEGKDKLVDIVSEFDRYLSVGADSQPGLAPGLERGLVLAWRDWVW